MKEGKDVAKGESGAAYTGDGTNTTGGNPPRAGTAYGTKVRLLAGGGPGCAGFCRELSRA